MPLGERETEWASHSFEGTIGPFLTHTFVFLLLCLVFVPAQSSWIARCIEGVRSVGFWNQSGINRLRCCRCQGKRPRFRTGNLWGGTKEWTIVHWADNTRCRTHLDGVECENGRRPRRWTSRLKRWLEWRTISLKRWKWRRKSTGRLNLSANGSLYWKENRRRSVWLYYVIGATFGQSPA